MPVASPNGIPGPGSVCAVFVAFEPSPEFASALSAIAPQVGAVVVVDNGSVPLAEERVLDPDVRSLAHWIHNAENAGVGAALNQGIDRARDLGYQWVVTLDQDSRAAPGMVSELIATLRRSDDPARIAMVGANPVETGTPGARYAWLRRRRGARWLFRKTDARGGDIADVTMVITSGALTSLSAYTDIGPFDEGLFIDYVDTEYCLRAQRCGYSIHASSRATLFHHLGKRSEVRFFGIRVRPTYHPPIRLYYAWRNRVQMVRTYGLAFPHWLLYDLLAAAYNLLRVVAFEDQKLPKLVACWQGTRDGMKGTMGRWRGPTWED